MTQVFSPTGEVIPVTVIKAGPCVVTQLRTKDRDGYEAVQVGFEQVPAHKLTSPRRGHLAAAGLLVRHLREFPIDSLDGLNVGDIIKVDMFKSGQRVDVVGSSKGRGFAGVVKRHGFRGGPRTHGQSDRVRAPGSIGGGTTPSRVWKGQRMAGRMGNVRVSIQNLEVVEVIPEKDILLVRGSVPGPSNGLIQIKHAVKVNG